MEIGLSPENEQFVLDQLAAGAFGTREELVNEAIRLLKRRCDLDREIQAGIDSGPSISGEEVFARLEARARRYS